MKRTKPFMSSASFIIMILFGTAPFVNAGAGNDNSSDSTQAEERPLVTEKGNDMGGFEREEGPGRPEADASGRDCPPEGETRGFEGPGDIPPTHPGLQSLDSSLICPSERAGDEMDAADKGGGLPDESGSSEEQSGADVDSGSKNSE